MTRPHGCGQIKIWETTAIWRERRPAQMNLRPGMSRTPATRILMEQHVDWRIQESAPTTWWPWFISRNSATKMASQLTARSMEDETRNAELNGNQNPASEWWGDFSQMQILIKKKSQFEFVPQDTSEFKSNQILNSTLYREIPRNLIFSILTSSLKSPNHSGFRLPFNSAFRVSSSTERAV